MGAAGGEGGGGGGLINVSQLCRIYEWSEVIGSSALYDQLVVGNEQLRPPDKLTILPPPGSPTFLFRQLSIRGFHPTDLLP